LLLNSGIFKKGLLIITLLVLFLPIIQNHFNLIKLYKLAGDRNIETDTTLTYATYFSGIYQKKADLRLSSDFGFRSLLIKINNQLNFSLFHKVNAQGVIVGKDNYLFETTYINSYLGKDFMGEDSINDYLMRFKKISDKFQKLNKHLILVIAPGKPSYFREFLPDDLGSIKNKNNYESIVEGIKKYKINCIDFSNWFHKTKYTAKYPLYPKHANHWSMYGSYLAADSMIKYIETEQKINLPNLLLKKVILEQPKNEDKDIEYGINLLFKLKSYDLATPEITIEDTIGKIKPNVLVIGDSFYWNIYNSGISNCFNKSSFWYYNKMVYPDSYKKQLKVSDLNFGDEIKKHDVIIILATESNIKSFGWGFMENAEKFLN
jgi:hypothetical protein